MSDLTIAAVIGTLKVASVNRAVFSAVAGLMPDGVELIEAPIADVPLFSEDVEAAGDPVAVTAMKDAVRAADALIIFTPEYNRSIPGVTKNTIDWLSRPVMAGPLLETPTGIVAASPGRGDAAGSRAHTAHAAIAAGARVFEESLGIPSIYHSLDDLVVVDAELLASLEAWVGRFVSFVRG